MPITKYQSNSALIFTILRLLFGIVFIFSAIIKLTDLSAFEEVIVYDILGKEVAKLVNVEQSKGKYKVNFNATNFPSGTYYYKIITNNFTDTKMMKLVK